MLQDIPAHPPSSLVRQWLSASARQISRAKGFASGGIDAAHRHFARATEGRCVLTVDDPTRFAEFGAGEVRLGDTGIRLLTCESATGCRKLTHRPPARDHVILQCVLRGSFEVIQGNRHAQVNAGEALVVGSVGNTIKQWRGASTLLNIVMPQEALGRLLTEDESFAGLAPVEFGRMQIIELGGVASLAQFVGAVVSDLGDSGSVFRVGRMASQAEQALHMLMLKSLVPHQGHSEAEMVSTTAPFYVRRAESFMRAHLAEALTLGGLAEAGGVSSRTLQYGFRVYRKSTPMEALRKIRLTAAREALLHAPASGLRIGEIAKRCGYISVSHFSRDYRACFDESPSDTVRVQ